jgi:hypothetical protein
MKVIQEYSHYGGSEILKVCFPQIEQEVYSMIADVKVITQKKDRDSDIQDGNPLLSANSQFIQRLTSLGYQELSDQYAVEVPFDEIRPEGEDKEINYTKDKVVVGIQLDNLALVFYNIAQLKSCYNENKADVGVEIVPSHALSKEMSSGVSYGEHLIYDIERLKRHFPAVPVKVILIEED